MIMYPQIFIKDMSEEQNSHYEYYNILKRWTLKRVRSS